MQFAFAASKKTLARNLNQMEKNSKMTSRQRALMQKAQALDL